jgi:hypothetical protein
MSTLVAAANPATATTTTNQELSVQVSTDATNDPVWLGTPVTASATANLGEGDTANIVYTVDVSGSMENPSFNPFQPSVGDCDGDGLVGTALDAACVGLIAVNTSLGDASNLNIGLVAFGDGGKTADMDPTAGSQAFTSPPNADKDAAGGPDVDQVIHSLQTEYGGGGHQHRLLPVRWHTHHVHHRGRLAPPGRDRCRHHDLHLRHRRRCRQLL